MKPVTATANGMSTTHAAVRAVFVISMRAPAGVAYTSSSLIIAEDLIYLSSPIVTGEVVREPLAERT